MTSLSHIMLLLFLSTLPSFSSHVFTRAASTSAPSTRQQIIFMTAVASDDDEDDEDLMPQSPPPEVHVSANQPFLRHEPPELCQHNPCLEDQPPCAALSQQTGCLCPGISGASEPPHAPRIHELLPVKEGPDSGKVEVQWCAPPSVVSGYRLTIEGSGSPQEFTNTKRKGVVGYLEVGTKVCVEAMNEAGNSSPSEFSCQRYEPPKTFDNSLMVGVLVSVFILLLLIVIGAVVLCKYCQRTKRDSDDGLGNPSYSAAGTL